MFKKWKRVIAAVISSAMIFTCTGCTLGKNTAYALTVDGYQVKAGVYIYYSFTALSEAKNLAAKENEDLDTDDENALKKVKIEGKDFIDYVKDKTTESCINHVAIIKHFDELELSLSEEDKDQISEYVDSTWEANEDMFSGNGIGKESIMEVMESSFKSDEIFKAYYGEDGSEDVKEDQLKDYYTENHARVKYVGMDLHDAEGNDLDADGKKEIQDMANDFLKRAKSLSSDKEKMLKEFDKFQEEYDEFVTKQAEEAAGEKDEENIDEETTEAETTEAVTETATESEGETDSESSDSESDSGESEDAADDSENSEDEAEEATDENTDESSESSDEENDEAAVTTAPEDEENEETTTTTTSPYANEKVIEVVTTEEGTKEEDVTYTPSKECYDWIFNKAKTGVPEIVEDEDTMFVIVRLDINERMTDDDLWSETGVENVRYEMFSDDLQDMLDEWGSAYSVEKNQRAYKKYDPFKIESA